MGTVLRQILCSVVATSSLITFRAPSRTPLPVQLEQKLAHSIDRSRTDEVLRLVNEERVARSLEPLRRSPTLDAAADERVQDMAVRDYFAHISPDGVTPGDQILAAGYQALLCGENIASGYSTARDVLQAWMASSSHRANILEPRYQDIGLAFMEAPGTESGVLWAQEFGEPLPRRPSRNSEHRTLVPARLGPTRLARMTTLGS